VRRSVAAGALYGDGEAGDPRRKIGLQNDIAKAVAFAASSQGQGLGNASRNAGQAAEAARFAHEGWRAQTPVNHAADHSRRLAHAIYATCERSEAHDGGGDALRVGDKRCDVSRQVAEDGSDRLKARAALLAEPQLRRARNHVLVHALFFDAPLGLGKRADPHALSLELRAVLVSLAPGSLELLLCGDRGAV